MRMPYHMVLGMYGFWLPNDPRGSWSHFVGSWELLQYGKATTVSSKRSHARLEHDHAQRIAAKNALKYPPVVLNGVQARAMARGFGAYVSRTGMKVLACAILPQHIHMVFEQDTAAMDKTVSRIKAAGTNSLVSENMHPLQNFRGPAGGFPKCFARGSWLQCLEANEVQPAIQYLRDNPVKEGKREQSWGFVSA